MASGLVRLKDNHGGARFGSSRSIPKERTTGDGSRGDLVLLATLRWAVPTPSTKRYPHLANGRKTRQRTATDWVPRGHLNLVALGVAPDPLQHPGRCKAWWLNVQSGHSKGTKSLRAVLPVEVSPEKGQRCRRPVGRMCSLSCVCVVGRERFGLPSHIQEIHGDGKGFSSGCAEMWWSDEVDVTKWARRTLLVVSLAKL